MGRSLATRGALILRSRIQMRDAPIMAERRLSHMKCGMLPARVSGYGNFFDPNIDCVDVAVSRMLRIHDMERRFIILYGGYGAVG